MTRRYDQYPQLAAQLREMSPWGRELVAQWHRVLTTALEGYIPAAKRECNESMGPAARLGAGWALERWLIVMRDVAAVIVDPSEADWCCKPGMLASPNPCPQHGFDISRDYELGTIIRRTYGHGQEHAVCVLVEGELTGEKVRRWRSVEFSLSYDRSKVAQGNWTVVGRV